MRVRILRSKHRPNLENSVHVRLDRHLLIQLRRLRQARGLAHVIQLEHGRAALGRAADELRRVNLHEVLPPKRLPEQLAHRALHAKDGLVRRRPQIDDAVVQPRVLKHADVLRAVFLIEIALRARRVVDLRVVPYEATSGWSS
eukprot:31522-Pelagococcus_subviridis.AAC.5